MTSIKSVLSTIIAAAFVLTLSACSPEVGSEKWCTQMKEKPKGEWSANDTKEFAKSCIFK